jgi:hypothetical protein
MMLGIKYALAFLALSFLFCVNPADVSNQSEILKVGRCFVYSINEIYKDTNGIPDSIIGVMIIRVDNKDSIRNSIVFKEVNTTQYYSGRKYNIDAIYTSNSYVQETDSFLISRAYWNNAGTGMLMKRSMVGPTDSVSSMGDSVCIENEDDKSFSKFPYIGLTWIQRPDWLQYSVIGKEAQSVWGNLYDCFKISAAPLDSHPVSLNSNASYGQFSWVTSEAIIKTLVTSSLPDSVCCFPSYYRIELIDKIDGIKAQLDPHIYKARIIQKGWE